MFDIGFFEIVVVGFVAVVVLGPEKLPGTIRTVSLWIGRLRRSFNNIKSEIEKEVGADEIRRQLRNEEIMEKFRNTQSKVQSTIQSIKNETAEFTKNIELEADIAAASDSATTNKPESTADSSPVEEAVSEPAPGQPAAQPEKLQEVATSEDKQKSST